MATLILMVGLPGAGKTTRAKQLEVELPAVRYTPDEWFTLLELDGNDEALRARIEELQWRCASRVLSIGIDAILDFGLWAKEERDDYRSRAESIGAQARIEYLPASREELRRRIDRRNRQLPPGEIWVDPDEVERWWGIFQPPTEAELAGRARATGESELEPDRQ
ncbi:MAG TPA: ATP-binding protein [Fimbriimonadaceae bacterium]|nr:ATP-binding protein [Fimbriimonadaceae bacterium]